MWRSQNTAEAIAGASGGCSSPAVEAPADVSGGSYTKEAGTGITETDDLVKFAGKRHPWTLLAICVRHKKNLWKKTYGLLGRQKLGGVRASGSLSFGRSTQVSGLITLNKISCVYFAFYKARLPQEKQFPGSVI